MTREVLKKVEKANPSIRSHIEMLRKDYNREGANKDLIGTASCQYGMGLRDAGLITEQERRTLFIYTTVKVQK